MLDVGREDVAPKRDDGCMANDVVIKDRDIGSPSANIDQAHAGFLLFFT